jgi:hypothetical protein
VAGEILQQILDRHAQDHLILTLRTITQSTGNQRALIAGNLGRVRDHRSPSGVDGEGLCWIEESDNIDLLDLAAAAKVNRKASSPHAATPPCSPRTVANVRSGKTKAPGVKAPPGSAEVFAFGLNSP